MPSYSPSLLVGIVGAGTMGSGIAQVAAAAGHPVVLFDARPGAAEEAVAAVREIFAKLSAKGRMAPEAAAAAGARITVADRIGALKDAGFVVEAVIEDLEVKRRTFQEIERLVGADCILATNTSSLSITAIAAALKDPPRLVGMHFFNPAPLMDLVEVVRGLVTGREFVEVVFSAAKAWGKTPVLAASTPGFIVNRVARPFYGEALRLLNEGAAAPETIDAILREAGGFRMGPFELMDLIGNDVNLAVTRSVWQAFYGDARYRPSVLQEERVQGGFLGRKSRRGYYSYANGDRPPPPQTEPAWRPPKSVCLKGSGPLAAALARRLERGGVQIAWESGAVTMAVTNGQTAAQRAQDYRTRNFVLVDLALDYEAATRVAIAHPSSCAEAAVGAAVGALQAAGLAVSLVKDVPGMVVLRTVAMLANEAADAVNQGVCTVEGVDTAMKQGVNYPIGPLEWADRLGIDPLQAALRNLGAAYGEERYRVSPLVQELAWTGGLFHGAS
jgi:3-hydroxybutyryl-CoA dehydrogenase